MMDAMEEAALYTERLEKALLAKIDWMQEHELKQLKDDCKLFQTAFQAIYNVLMKKGLIHEDPYKYELKISEVTTPSEAGFGENERLDQMSVRLSQFDSYMDFLNNYYQFAIEFLTMARIKRMVALIKYFNFLQLTETSTSIATRYLAEMIGLIRKGSDPLSTGIIEEAMNQLDKASRRIFQTLKDLSFVHKERYKLDLRRKVTLSMKLDRDFVVTHRDDAVRKIKQKLAEAGGDHSFHPDMAEELLREDYGTDGDSLHDEILKKLAVKEDQGKSAGVKRNYKAVVLEGARTMIAVGFQLEDALRKIQENQTLLESIDRSFMTKLKRFMKQVFRDSTEHVVHDVDYLDPITSERRNETIDVTAFAADATKRAQSFVGMVTKNSTSYKRLEAASEEQAYLFLEKGIEDLQSYHRKLVALDEFYQGALTVPEVQGRVRSIRIELSSIKTAIIKSNQKRHEYIAQKEEQEQMRRLGIREA